MEQIFYIYGIQLAFDVIIVYWVYTISTRLGLNKKIN